MRAELVVDCQNTHGEGIFWNAGDNCIWWTDIEGSALWSFNPTDNSSRSIPMPDRVCCFAPRESGGLIVAFADRISLFNTDTGQEQKFYDFEPDNPETRLNDGRTDRQGRLIVGGMNEKSGAANSSVIRVNTDLSVEHLFGGVSCANSTCFSADGSTMFFADTPNREIVAYDYDTTTGEASGKRLFTAVDSGLGLPDGSCVDAQGGVWNAEWEGRQVVRYAADGSVDCIVEVPVWKPTCCAFGGQNLDTLYITTSRLMSDESALLKEPQSGGLFAVKPGFTGVQDATFGG